MDLYYANLIKLEFQFLELLSLNSSLLTWSARNILHNIWKMSMKEQTISSKSLCREQGTVASHTDAAKSGNLYAWQEVAAEPLNLPGSAVSSDSASPVSGPSACLALRQGFQFAFQNDPILEVESLDAGKDWQEFQPFLVISGLALTGQVFHA